MANWLAYPVIFDCKRSRFFGWNTFKKCKEIKQVQEALFLPATVLVLASREHLQLHKEFKNAGTFVQGIFYHHNHMHICPYSRALGICKSIGIRSYLAPITSILLFSATGPDLPLFLFHLRTASFEAHLFELTQNLATLDPNKITRKLLPPPHSLRKRWNFHLRLSAKRIPSYFQPISDQLK